MNYYEILKVSKDASDKEIKDSYKTLIKQYHPDIYNGSKEFAEKITMELNNAYAVLSDSNKRAEYDLSLLPPSDDNLNNFSEQTNDINYQNNQYYQNNYTEQNQEEENWNQKFKKKLYNYVDDHTKNLNSKAKASLVLIVILVALLFMLLSIIDYLRIVMPM